MQKREKLLGKLPWTEKKLLFFPADAEEWEIHFLKRQHAKLQDFLSPESRGRRDGLSWNLRYWQMWDLSVFLMRESQLCSLPSLPLTQKLQITLSLLWNQALEL